MTRSLQLSSFAYLFLLYGRRVGDIRPFDVALFNRTASQLVFRATTDSRKHAKLHK